MLKMNRSSEEIDWKGRKLPPLPSWPGYSRPAPRSTKIKNCGRGGPLDFDFLELKLGPGFRVLYEVEPRLGRRVLLARLLPSGEQVVIVSDIENGHTPQFPQPVYQSEGVGSHFDFLGNPLPQEAMSSRWDRPFAIMNRKLWNFGDSSQGYLILTKRFPAGKGTETSSAWPEV